MTRKAIFDSVGQMVPGIWNKPGTVPAMDKLLDLAGIPTIVPAAQPLPLVVGAAAVQSSIPVEKIKITAPMAAEIVGHEAIVLEAYKDSEGVWTWGIGVTDASGHSVMRYKDAPSTIEKVLGIYIWLLETVYAPAVRKEFAGCLMTEAEFTAALSFHYNTGAILRTEWTDLAKAGKRKAARDFLESHYLNGGDLTERRKKEAALFFDGTWSGDGKTTVWPVKKPSYRPDWGNGKRIDILTPLKALLP